MAAYLRMVFKKKSIDDMKKGILSIVVFLSAICFMQAQNPNEVLVKLAKHDAAFYAERIALEEDKKKSFENIFTGYALNIENSLTSKGDFSLRKEIEKAKKTRDKGLKKILSNQQHNLLEYIEESEGYEKRRVFARISETIKSDSTLQNELHKYAVKDMLPHLVRHREKLEQQMHDKDQMQMIVVRSRINDIIGRADSVSVDSLVELRDLAVNKDEHKAVRTLKKLRKKYIDELDYISGSLIPRERSWRGNYLRILQQHLENEDFLEMSKLEVRSNALGYDYYMGQLTMLLLDTKNSKDYLELNTALNRLIKLKI